MSYSLAYTFGNHILRIRLRVAVKRNFRQYIRRYTSPNENFEYRFLTYQRLQDRVIPM